MFPILLMIGTGVGLAIVVMAGITWFKAMANGEQRTANREGVAASILYNLLLAGGARPDEAMRDLRAKGIGAAVTPQIEISNWSQHYAQTTSPQQREWLLETAVQLAAKSGKPLPLLQYSMLLDISFALGFHTDALAKLREQYPFEYVDHAKHGRPREADRGGGSLPLFVRGTTDTTALLHILGIEGDATRQRIISTYRRLATQHHPDKLIDASDEIRSESAAKFIEITRAYEALLAIYRD